jgi:hypothetical protein
VRRQLQLDGRVVQPEIDLVEGAPAAEDLHPGRPAAGPDRPGAVAWGHEHQAGACPGAGEAIERVVPSQLALVDVRPVRRDDPLVPAEGRLVPLAVGVAHDLARDGAHVGAADRDERLLRREDGRRRCGLLLRWESGSRSVSSVSSASVM